MAPFTHTIRRALFLSLSLGVSVTLFTISGAYADTNDESKAIPFDNNEQIDESTLSPASPASQFGLMQDIRQGLIQEDGADATTLPEPEFMAAEDTTSEADSDGESQALMGSEADSLGELDTPEKQEAQAAPETELQSQEPESSESDAAAELGVIDPVYQEEAGALGEEGGFSEESESFGESGDFESEPRADEAAAFDNEAAMLDSLMFSQASVAEKDEELNEAFAEQELDAQEAMGGEGASVKDSSAAGRIIQLRMAAVAATAKEAAILSASGASGKGAEGKFDGSNMKQISDVGSGLGAMKVVMGSLSTSVMADMPAAVKEQFGVRLETMEHNFNKMAAHMETMMKGPMPRDKGMAGEGGPIAVGQDHAKGSGSENISGRPMDAPMPGMEPGMNPGTMPPGMDPRMMDSGMPEIMPMVNMGDLNTMMFVAMAGGDPEKFAQGMQQMMDERMEIAMARPMAGPFDGSQHGAADGMVRPVGEFNGADPDMPGATGEVFAGPPGMDPGMMPGFDPAMMPSGFDPAMMPPGMNPGMMPGADGEPFVFQGEMGPMIEKGDENLPVIIPDFEFEQLFDVENPVEVVLETCDIINCAPVEVFQDPNAITVLQAIQDHFAEIGHDAGAHGTHVINDIIVDINNQPTEVDITFDVDAVNQVHDGIPDHTDVTITNVDVDNDGNDDLSGSVPTGPGGHISI